MKSSETTFETCSGKRSKSSAGWEPFQGSSDPRLIRSKKVVEVAEDLENEAFF